MLNIKNLSLKLDHTPDLLHDITFSIKENETFALLGESGSGKTLTALSILHLIPGAIYTKKSQILWQNKNLLTLTQNDLQSIRGKDIGYIFQEPSLSLNPTHTIGHQIAETFLLHETISKKDAYTKTRDILAKVGFGHANLDAYPHQLSGGQKQRVMIAIAISVKPKLIIADEPTTALDRNIQKEIIDLLKTYKAHASMLLISHDISVVEALADRVGVMQGGRIIETGPTKTILHKPKEVYTKTIIESEPYGKPVEVKSNQKIILKTENLGKYYTTSGFLWNKKPNYILQNITFELKKGRTLGVIGESGSGKTTLAKLLVKLEKPSHGHFSLNVEKSFRSSIQLIFQDPYGSLNPKMKIEDIIKEGLIIHKPTANHDTIVDIIHTVGLESTMLNRYPHQFSGGQRQRIAIARALVLEPDVLILDEPTSSLDRTVQKEILLLLKKLQKEKGLSYILISHDLKVVRSICHDVLVLKDGHMIEHGKTDQVFKHPQHEYTHTLVELSF